MNLSTNQIRLLIFSNISSWLVLLCVLFMSFNSNPNNHFEEITAKRINVVNEDGTTVIAIANKERIANPRVGGKEYPVAVADGRKYMAGMIFFNEEGDEMGGLVFNSFRQKNGRIAGIGHLSFDRYNDNQVISLEYNQNKKGVKSGLTFYDRPGDNSFRQSLDLLEEVYTVDSISKERLQVVKDSLRYLSKSKKLGSDRVFIGSKNKIPQLLMKDELGNVRIKMQIDSTNIGRIQFFDEKGQLISQIPEK